MLMVVFFFAARSTESCVLEIEGVGFKAQSKTTGAASPTLIPPKIPPQRLVLSLTFC
jgi:hypothetical protein